MQIVPTQEACLENVEHCGGEPELADTGDQRKNYRTARGKATKVRTSLGTKDKKSTSIHKYLLETQHKHAPIEHKEWSIVTFRLSTEKSTLSGKAPKIMNPYIVALRQSTEQYKYLSVRASGQEQSMYLSVRALQGQRECCSRTALVSHKV